MDRRGSSASTSRTIAERQVAEAQREVAGYDQLAVRQLGQRFLAEQPALARFLTVLPRSAPGPASEFAFYVGCVLWTVFRRAAGGNLPPVGEDLLVERFLAIRDEMKRFVGSDERFLERYLRHAAFMRQPHVVRLLVDLVLDPRPEWAALGRQSRGVCLVVLLAALQALDERLPQG